MTRLRSTFVLAVATLIVAVSGFTYDAASRPDALQASSNCGQFSGNPCATICQRECSDGSCCHWSFYYYLKVEPQ